MGGEDLLEEGMGIHSSSCLESLMDRGALWITVLGVARVQTDLGRKPPPRPPPESLQRGFPITWSFSALASFLFLPFPAFQHRGEQGALVSNCSLGGPALPSLGSASSAQFLFHSHPTCLSGSPSLQLWSPCQYIFLLHFFSVLKESPPPPSLWDSCMLSHTWHPALYPNYFALPPVFFLLLGFSAAWSVPILQSAINIWTQPVQSEESSMLISLPNSAQNQWVFIMAQGLGFPFLKGSIWKIFGNIYFVPLAWCESSSYLVSESPVFFF